jgi:hypothetical protein
VYSIFDNDILHFISPLFLLIPSYSILLLDLDGHSTTNLCSPGGAFTLLQPVVMAKSFPSCVESAVFHCSLSPLYRLVYMSLVTSLYRYSQHERSGSYIFVSFLVCVDCHISGVVFVVVCGITGCIGAASPLGSAGLVMY